MNILLSTYPEAFVNPGGGEIELINLSSQLTSLPILNQIYSYSTHGVKSFTHFVHFSVVPSGLNLAKTIFESSSPGSKKYLWPLFWPSDNYKHDFEYLEMFDGVIFKSKSEYELFKKSARKNFKELIINDFVDRNFLRDNQHLTGIFSDIYGFNNRKFNLWIGVIERSKKQLDFINKVKNLNEIFVFIGGSNDLDYLNQCREMGKNNCIFLDFIDNSSDLLISALLDCNEYFEFPQELGGTSVIEALSQGCIVNIFDSQWASELADRFKIIKNKNRIYSDILGAEVVTLQLNKNSEDDVSSYSFESQVIKLIHLMK